MDQTLSSGIIQREDQPVWEQIMIDMSETNTNVLTPLIIPQYLYDAHSSLFPKGVAEHKEHLHTHDNAEWT